ncbi:MAG: Type I Iterative PKS [Bathelium mastoideum]|nr:MAG: Type I Iterative PKS [Bathelium mastoideum]
MAHSILTDHLHDHGANGTSNVTTETQQNGLANGNTGSQTDERTKLYTDAYTHGYTDGYIKRHIQPEMPEQTPIAIVGMSCRLPGGVSSPDEFWELCSRARDGWSEIPKQRFETASFHHPNPGKSGCFNATGGNFLQEDVGLFDAPFFSLTAQEATSMDPQQRLLLECTFEALDSAGIPKHQIVGEEVGVFIGGSFSEYESQLFADTETIPMYQATDEGRSFSFDNRGTGYGRGEGCGMIILKPLEQAQRDNDIIRSVIMASGINQDGKTPGITMPNGSAQESLIKSVYKAASIDPKETGYVEAHGTGTKVGDPIEASALHSVFNEDRSVRKPLFIGSVKSNIGHLEGASGIVSVIKTAMMLERGFILPNHDFRKPNEKIPFDKWHLKVPVRQLPWPKPKRFASVNNFGFGGTNAHVVLERAPYMSTNQPESRKSILQGRRLYILTANDKNAVEASMKNLGIYLEQRPEFFQDDLMSNVAYTLGQRRSLMTWRVGIPATSSFELVQALSSGKVVINRESEPLRIGFVFTGQGAQWSGMGRELYETYPVFTSTINACDRYLGSIGAPFSLTAELSKDETASCINEAHISQPACTAVQIALTDLLRAWGILPTAVAGHSSGEIGAAYAVGSLSLESCMAISYQRGMTIVELTKNFSKLRGAMMAVGASKDEIDPLINQLKSKAVRIACFNSPTSLTISGDAAAIDELQDLTEKEGIFNRKIQVDVAYHSHHMELVADRYREMLVSLDLPKSTEIEFYSSLHGRLISNSRLGPSYWVDNLTQPVRFSEAMTSMCKPANGYRSGVNIIVEIGPHSALAGPIKQILKACGSDAMKIPYASALVRKGDAVETALDLAATLFTKGVNLDLGAINFPVLDKSPTLLIDMPRYPWNHKTRYWHEPRVMQKQKGPRGPRNDLLGILAPYSNDLEPTWRNILRLDDLPWLRQHKIQSLNLFPISGFVAMAIEAAAQRAHARNVRYDTFELRHISVNTPLRMTDDNTEVTLQLRSHQEGALVSSDLWDEFRIHSWSSSEGWKEHCKGLVTVKSTDCNDASAVALPQTSGASLQASITEAVAAGSASVDKARIFDSLADLGVAYGPSFQGLNDCKASETCSTATMVAVDTREEMPHGYQTDMIVQPAFLEQLVQMYWPVLGAGSGPIATVYLPSSIGHLKISAHITNLSKMPGDSLRAFCKGNPKPSYPKPVQVTMVATAAQTPEEAIITLDDLTISPIVERDITLRDEEIREICYKLDWEPAFEPLNLPKPTHAVNGFSGHPAELTNGTTNGMPNGVSNGTAKEPDIVIVHGDSEVQLSLALRLADSLDYITGKRPAISNLAEVQANGKICLFLPEMTVHKPLLSSLTLDQFTTLQKLLTSVQGILWVVQGAYVKSSNPDANMVMGLSRSIRSETMLKFATLDLDAESQLNEERAVHAIVDVFRATFGPHVEPGCELEFMERNGKLFTPRIINDTEMNEYIYKQTKPNVLEHTPFTQDDRSLQLAIGTPGVLETLHFVDQPRDEDIADDAIEIEVKAIGMNERDLGVVMGQLDHLDPGSECSGIVTKVGNSSRDFAIGDHVTGISASHGIFSTHARIKAGFAMKINKQASFADAASMPMAYITAKYSLIDLGRVLEEEKVLICGGSSAIGQAAIVLARLSGADTFATVKTVEDKQLLMKLYEICEDHIISAHDISFGASIRRAHGKGTFDLVLKCDSMDADALGDLWNCLSNFGRFIEVKNQDTATRLEIPHHGNNKSFMSVDLISMAVERPQKIEALLSDVSDLLGTSKIKLIGTTVFPISEVETVFKALQHGNVPGKLIIEPQPGDLVKATPSKIRKDLLQPDATYVLVGGTGGLGRSMALWMVDNGAKNVVLVSRSGRTTGKVKELIDEAASRGAVVKVRSCDVSKRDSVQNLIRNELVGLPEVRGIVHGAMVLHDVLFEKMSFDQYSTVIESKVRGAWNLHDALENAPLDFFVTLSSAAGAVGNRGQAAYAAANTFLNAFVQYRITKGFPASSIDLTAVSDAGYLAENLETAAEVARNLGSDTLCEAEVLALLRAAIDGTLARACGNHTITGMRITPSPPFWTHDAKFKHLRIAAEAAAAEKSDTQAAKVSFNSALKAAQSLEDAHNVVCRGLVHEISTVLMLEEEDMDINRSLSAYALDSLVAIEVRNFITREFEANLQVLELLSSGSICTLAHVICGKSRAIAF